MRQDVTCGFQVCNIIAVVTPRLFISHAQNCEDVVLWRALAQIQGGRYVEVGANHPENDSITRSFYDAGWSGITVEPVTMFADLHRTERPRDLLVEAVIADSGEATMTLHIFGDTGLSTIVDEISEEHQKAGLAENDVVVPVKRLDDVLADAGWEGTDIHLMTIDTEGAEASVLHTIDMRTWRPWVLVIESTLPNTATPSHDAWESSVIDAGYEFCLFDGLSRFYVAVERAAELRAALSYPACILDRFVKAPPHASPSDFVRMRVEIGRQANEITDLTRDLVRWRSSAVAWWSEALGSGTSRGEAEQLHTCLEAERSAAAHWRNEVDAIHRTLSWRVTAPLRSLRRPIGSRA